MSKQIINLGQADKGNGDPLRTAFNKVNENFTELYNAIGEGVSYHLGDDVQFVDIDPASGIVVIQSGFDTGMPVYIKGANCSDGGVGGNVIIEAGGAPLGIDNFINGTTGNVEVSGNDITIDAGGGITTFASGDGTPYVTFPAVNGSQLGIQGNEIGSLPGSEGLALSAREGPILLATHGDQYPALLWEFDRSGTINTPLLFPKSFTAVLDAAHCITNPDLSTTGPAWEFNLQWQVNPGGEIECISDNGPLPSLIQGYSNGLVFEFTEADHGIPNYTLTIELYNVVNNAGLVNANLNFSAPPTYPSTINSQGAIKLTSNEYSLILDSEGTIIFPKGGRIGDISHYAPGLSTGFFDTNGVSMGTFPGNDITITPEDGIGIYSNSNLWTFSTDGKLQLPVGGDIVDSDGNTVLGGVGGGSGNKLVNGSYNFTLGVDGTVNFDPSTNGNGVLQTTSDLQFIASTKTWTFGTAGTLQLPTGGSVNFTYGGIRQEDFNSPVFISSGRSVVIGTDEDSQQWTFGTDRTLTVPLESSIQSQVIPEVGTIIYGIRAYDFRGPSCIWIDAPQNLLDLASSPAGLTGWTFSPNGTHDLYTVTNVVIDGNNIDITFHPALLPQNTYSVRSPDYSVRQTSPVNLVADGNTWSFGTDGLLTFPGADGFRATFGSVAPAGDVLHSVNSLYLESELTVNLTSGNQVVDLEVIYNDSVGTLNNAFAAQLWTGAGYPASHTSYHALSVAKALNPLIPDAWLPLAQSVMDAHDAWQSALDASEVNISIAGSKVWNFGNDGKLTLPAGGDIVDSTGTSVLGGAVSVIDGGNASTWATP